MSVGQQTSRRFLLPVSVVVQAKKMGVSAEKLQEMVRKSARITHPDGNRRFHEFLFMVEGERVKAIKQMSNQEHQAEERKVQGWIAPPKEPPAPFYKCETCRDTGKMVVFDECDRCYGAGCRSCDDGLVRREVDCPDCRKKEYIGVYSPRDRRRYR